MSHKLVPLYIGDGEYYTRTDTDNVIAEKDAEIAELKNGIAPKQSDKTLQERLNEVCKKHAVSTLQDLDWAFCESEKGRARDFIEAVKAINHHKYKRSLAMAMWCFDEGKGTPTVYEVRTFYWGRWGNIWLALAEKFKPNKSTA